MAGLLQTRTVLCLRALEESDSCQTSDEVVRWRTESHNVRLPPIPPRSLRAFCEDHGGSRVARPSDFSPRVKLDQ
eukprot:7174716-Prymnesium_polylepis.1